MGRIVLRVGYGVVRLGALLLPSSPLRVLQLSIVDLGLQATKTERAPH